MNLILIKENSAFQDLSAKLSDLAEKIEDFQEKHIIFIANKLTIVDMREFHFEWNMETRIRTLFYKGNPVLRFHPLEIIKVKDGKFTAEMKAEHLI